MGPSTADASDIGSTMNTGGTPVTTQYARGYFFSRITLDALTRAFPSCSRLGTTSFSRAWFARLESYKPSQVHLLVGLRAIGCQGASPAIETEPYASRFVTLDILYTLATSIARSLRPAANTANRHGDHTPGGIPEPNGYMESY
ncbi:hypothetical protein F5141DRAFT_1062429 [Pisolithus sp. B1]|nr:hypothetical protein F5141DRAFT_1062429 [Pisolithus sp. B1]